MEEVLAKYFSGNLTDEERKKVELWRSESEDNASEFYQFKEVWNDSQTPDVDIKNALDSVLNKIDIQEEEKVIPIQQNQQTSQISFSGFLKYAAAIVIAAGLAFVYFGNDVFAPEGQVVVSTNTIREIALTDGSVVTLHRNSTLTYDRDFNGTERRVTLSGKAFFDVKRDESKPFIVSTANSEVTVLGTSFMVESNLDSRETEVVVVTGRVGVMNKSKELLSESLNVELTPGQSISVTDNRSDFVVENTQEVNFLSWKTGVLSFENEKLEDVVLWLEDVYNISVKFSDSNMNNCRLSAKFDQDKVDEILSIIGATYGFESVKTGENSFELRGTGCIYVN